MSGTKVAYVFTTMLGIGYFPKMPGTVASAVTSLLLFLIKPSFISLSLFTVCIFIIGIFFIPVIENKDGKDASHIVLDELCGQSVVFLFIEIPDLITVISAFILFRIFDIWKPAGINQLQKLNGGWGVLLDDVLAGIYSGLILLTLIKSGIIQ